MEPGALVAAGRDAEIYDFGPGLVLRRARDGRSIEREAVVMRHVAEHGYPVPAVVDVRAGGSEIVMERVDGPLMMQAMLKGPRRFVEHASLLANLHDRLHEIVAPDGMPQLPDGGDRVVHLDLHPLNVMLSARGPVVIDWSNAQRGEGLSDVAATYVLLTCPRMPAPAAVRFAVKGPRRLLGRLFTERYRGPALDARIAIAAEMKALDRNMLPDEVAACRRLAARMRRKIAGSGA